MLTVDGKPTTADLNVHAPIYEIARLADTGPHHLVVAYVPGRLVAYMDGKKVFETAEVKGSLKAWNYGELCFGMNHNGGPFGWQGKLEGIAIYKRFMGEAEAKRNADISREKIRSRPVLPQIELAAVLRAVSQIPDASKIAPYREALVINEYEVTKVGQTSGNWKFPGQIKPGARIRVAQWGLLDGIRTDIARAKVGDTRVLFLEVFDKHPEKVDEIILSDTLEIADLPLLYEPLR
jgi:hypothetical protein